eukprot:4118435-Amphidinium_carterae.1
MARTRGNVCCQKLGMPSPGKPAFPTTSDCQTLTFLGAPHSRTSEECSSTTLLRTGSQRMARAAVIALTNISSHMDLMSRWKIASHSNHCHKLQQFKHNKKSPCPSKGRTVIMFGCSLTSVSWLGQCNSRCTQSTCACISS